MKKIKHLSLLLLAALITAGIYAQTATTSGTKAQPAAAQSSMLRPKTSLKMPPPNPPKAATKPAPKPVQPSSGVAKPAGGVTK